MRPQTPWNRFPELKKRERVQLIYNPDAERWRVFNQYMVFFREIFFSQYSIKGIEDDLSHYVIKSLWRRNTIAAFQLLKGHSEAGVGFAPYTPTKWNYFHYPSEVMLMRIWNGDGIVPTGNQVVGEDVILGFAYNGSRQFPPATRMEYYAGKIAELELTKAVNNFGHRLPIGLADDPSITSKLEELASEIARGNFTVRLPANALAAIGRISANPQYILDKLSAEQQVYFSMALSELGIDNAGYEKNERLLVDEVNASSQYIKLRGRGLRKSLERFVEEINSTFGASLALVDQMDEMEREAEEKAKQRRQDMIKQEGKEDVPGDDKDED